MISTAERIKIGPAGWSYPDWNGIVYPKRKGAGFDPLAYISAYFDTIEINSTFYRPPDPSTSRSWARRISGQGSFLFTVKLWRRFTHEGLSPGGKETSQFNRGLDPLRESGRMGALLIQFPWSFKNSRENRRHLTALFNSFQADPLVVEVRHASWDVPEFYDLLSEHNAGFVNIDQPLFGRSLRPSAHATAAIGYVRLHGQNRDDWFRADAGRDARYDYLYSAAELEPWVEKISGVSESTKTTYVITNNHYRGKAVCNALQIRHMLLREPVAVPEPMLVHYPLLAEMADNLPVQGTLF